MRTLLRLAAILCLPLLGACSMTMNLPADFLCLEQGASHYKAITPDDGRLWVREFADPADGTLPFWTTTLQNDCVQNRGYELIGATDVRDGSGHPGQQLEFRTVAEGERYGYLVSLFLLPKSFWPWSDQHVLVTEFTAREAVFAQRLPAVRAAIGTLQP
jgi:hypothetical protein